MWFFLLISGFVYRSCISELAELYEALYKDQEPLPNPDMSSFMSIVKLAPLSIWLHLNQKPNSNSNLSESNAGPGGSGSAQLANKTKALIVPDILQNHHALLQEFVSTANYQDFRLSACLNACMVQLLVTIFYFFIYIQIYISIIYDLYMYGFLSRLSKHPHFCII